jgi:hypothetical protein
MSEEKEEGSTTTGELDKPLEEVVVRPISLDVTENQISKGEVPSTVLQEEMPQEEKPQEMEQAQEESRVSKTKPKRRITSYLSNMSKQVEKQGNQINKTILMIQSLQKQEQTKLTADRGVGKLQSQFIKQIQSQVSQLQKQVTRIQKDIQRIRKTSGIGTSTKSKI